MMGSRSGSMDPGAVIYLLKNKGFTADQLEEFLYYKCGLQGISNISNDVKILENDNSVEAKRALQLYCYTAAKYIGATAMAIGGIDAVVFTGGIGENSSYIRLEICSYLNWLDVLLDDTANAVNSQKISKAESAIPIYAITTDEEQIIAKNCAKFI